MLESGSKPLGSRVCQLWYGWRRKMLKEDRSLGKYILLSICTCGFYGLYYIYTMAQDSNTLCEGDGKKTPGLLGFILLAIVTCGIYALYWEYSLGNRLSENAPRYGMDFQENGTTVLLWNILGSLLFGIGHFVAINILIKNMNALAHQYNQANPKPQMKQNFSQAEQQEGFQSEQQAGLQNSIVPEQQASVQDAIVTGQQPNASNSIPSCGFGNYTDFTMPAEEWKPDFSDSPKGGSIECCKGTYEGTVIPIDGEVVIGRDETCCHVVIKGKEISRKHCGISYDKGTGSYFVTDYSSNGVFDKDGQEFPKNVPVACGAGTVLVIAESGNEFLLK